MKKYTLVGAATFGPGAILQLTADQATPRAHALKALGEGRFEARAAVQFKAGEIVGYEGDLPKAMAAQLLNPPASAGEDAAASKPVHAPAAKTWKGR